MTKAEVFELVLYAFQLWLVYSVGYARGWICRTQAERKPVQKKGPPCAGQHPFGSACSECKSWNVAKYGESSQAVEELINTPTLGNAVKDSGWRCQNCFGMNSHLHGGCVHCGSNAC